MRIAVRLREVSGEKRYFGDDSVEMQWWCNQYTAVNEIYRDEAFEFGRAGWSKESASK